nr:glycosyltransferase family 1 protein [Ancylobacter dichloromethanicus]
MRAPATGVHRVAKELIVACARIASDDVEGGNGWRLTVVAPTSPQKTFLPPDVDVVRSGGLSGILKDIPWEHLNLPALARDNVLVNLCNLGPVGHKNSITMIHDAQVYLVPTSYGTLFRIWYRFLLPIIGRTSKKIVTISEFSKLELSRFGVARKENIVVIHNGCDHVLGIEPSDDVLSQFGLENRHFVLALSNTQPHKNISILLKAFSADELQDVSLVLFGPASAADFERAGCSVPPNVKFVGRVTDEQLVGLMRGASAFACPSLTEGFGLPPLEAMALGCPAIISPCGALPEICGDAAIEADPYLPEAWIQAVRRLVDDPDLASDYRARGLERSKLFTWQKAAEKLLRTIRSERDSGSFSV